MGKSKPKRSLKNVGIAQKKTEANVEDKFSQTASLAQNVPVNKKSTTGRISPQLSCTIGVEEKKMLDELTVFATNQSGKAVNTSIVLRALIRLGYENKNKLDFND
jgi:hypothetical protein